MDGCMFLMQFSLYIEREDRWSMVEELKGPNRVVLDGTWMFTLETSMKKECISFNM
jgi:hypothetical protein